MKIRVRRSGEIFHVEKHWLLSLLISDGMIEEYHDQPARPPREPRIAWDVYMSSGGNPVPLVGVFCSSCGQRDGTHKPTDKVEFRCQCGGFEKIPEGVLQRWRELKATA